jgi:hypothetical protein
MSVQTLPLQTRRTIAIGLLAVVVAITGAVAWWFASSFVFDLDKRAASAQERVSSLSSMAGSMAQWRAAWARLERDPRLAVDMYGPSSDAQASAAVQASTQRTFTRAGATVRSVQTLDVVQEGAVRRVGVRIAVTGTSNQINRALEAISAARPVLMVAAGGVQTMGDSRRPVSDPKAPQLQATFDIYAFARNG